MKYRQIARSKYIDRYNYQANKKAFFEDFDKEWLHMLDRQIDTEIFLKTRFSRCILYRRNAAIGTD